MVSPEVSARSPRWPASEIVRIARRTGRRKSLLHAPLGPERELHHLCGQAVAAAVDLEPGAGLGRVGGQVGGADAVAEGGTQGPAPDDVDFSAVVEHRIAAAGEAAPLELEADQPASDAAELLDLERLDALERRALVELHDPAEVGLERRDGIVDLVAVEGVAHLEAERVAGAEADGLGAGPEDGIPERAGVAVAAVELEAVLAGV